MIPDHIDVLKRRLTPLLKHGDLQDVILHIKDRKVVMLGEASHGTHEYYHWRAQITQELISKHGFHFVAVEGDWPSCQYLDRYVRSSNLDKLPFVHFARWPAWMWANEEVRDFTTWLKSHNHLKNEKPVGFHGLDVYSLFESIDAIFKTVGEIEPDLMAPLKEYYSCFASYRHDEKKYVKDLMRNYKGCRDEAVSALEELLEKNMTRSDNSLFDAIQNARVIKNAESYYRAMTDFEDSSWNVRDRHMLETLEALLRHYGPDAKAIVWAHNTHIGDYRATDMVLEGSINIGGLAREIFGERNVALVGFGSYQGSVIASPAWAGPVRVMNLPRGQSGSYEDLFHQVAYASGYKNYSLNFFKEDRSKLWAQSRGHRAVGVVYNPHHERGNYVSSKIAERYDSFLFFDESRALSPLKQEIDRSEIPETYPSGL
ncbi:erythromycin esterase family protein [Bdellovibrio bacteriovorus]|uniref:erythromycin esterase family protein n=1 Tax=Bdellovibrio bacteriovorus TaxID=959 RepID=UPI0035A573EC